MTHPSNTGQTRSRVVIAAVITACATILAAFIAHHSGSSNGSASSPPTPAATSTRPRTPPESPPRSTHSPTPPSTPSPSPSPSSPLSTKAKILIPEDDPGYSPIWRGTLLINPAGVRISNTGLYAAGPNNWDLAYQTGNDGNNGWQENGNNNDDGVIYPYAGTGTPGPAWCHRDFFTNETTSTAQVGDRDCYGDMNGVVGYLQVISVGPNGPTVKAWFWKGPTP